MRRSCLTALCLACILPIVGCRAVAGYTPSTTVPDAANATSETTARHDLTHQPDTLADTALADTALADSALADSALADSALPDAFCPANAPSYCINQLTAQRCHEGHWETVPCFLGCVDSDGPGGAPAHCYHPSNIPLTFADLQAPVANTALPSNETIVLDSSTGAITRGGTLRVMRDPGGGVKQGIGFYIVKQPSLVGGVPPPELAVFVVGDLTVPATTTVRVTGPRAVVIVSQGTATLAGRIDLPADGSLAGAGGYAGGTPDSDGQGAGSDGQGPCPGLKGDVAFDIHIPTNNSIEPGCSTGAGGGGFGATGGKGGPSTYSTHGTYNNVTLKWAQTPALGGQGGGICGNATLIPLVGGSGGGGGRKLYSDNPAGWQGTSQPSPGGAGGGAIQIVAAMSIALKPGAIINVGGGGGPSPIHYGGGSGGGSGGAILLEAPIVSVATGAILAANGGGGGAGTCS
ncbi:MAG: hypothetical protein KAI47_13870 [Deltaproteobacteria bacterium]|nr:hypothetical protein [Deltaproteobacteria bacterium]